MSAHQTPSPSGAAHPDCSAGAIVLASGPDEAPGAFAPCWQPLLGKPLLAWAVTALAQAPGIGALALIVPPHRQADARTLASSETWPRATVVPARPRLRDSMLAGLAALPEECAWVVVHDGARPLLTPTLVSSVMAAARQAGAASASDPVKETLKRVRDGLVTATPERARLALLQTPQVFARDVLLALLRTANGPVGAPDAATLAVAARIPVVTIPADAGAPKVMTPADLALAGDTLARTTPAPALGNGEDSDAR